MEIKKKISILVVIVMLFTIGVFILSAQGAEYTKDNPMKVAFVYNSTVGDFGWFYAHDKARIKTEEALEWIKTSRLENVTPGAQAERVFKELCDDGYKVIIAASVDYQSEALKVAETYKDVDFLVAAGSKYKEPNVESYFPQRCPVLYLLGQIAGQLTKSNIIGMVGSIYCPHPMQENNAWIMGARSVNPDCVERLIYVGTFYDPAAERDAALSLIDAGADVICQATNSPAHVQAAEELGVYAMSVWENMKQYGPNAYVTGETLHWEKYYIETLKAIKDENWVPSLCSPGLEKGVSSIITPFGSMVTDEMIAKYEETRAKLIEDPMSIWEGPIYDNDGKLRVKEGERLSEEDLNIIDWHVEGIITSMKNR